MYCMCKVMRVCVCALYGVTNVYLYVPLVFFMHILLNFYRSCHEMFSIFTLAYVCVCMCLSLRLSNGSIS